jgi:glyceraldehyde 3-phosphate dehydrogenase
MRIAINGFGRIGRIFLRNILAKPGIQVIAINDLTDTATLAHLFKYDSVHRGFNGTVDFDADNLYINDQKIKVLAQRDPSILPWKKLDIDLVIESTGKFASRQAARLHLDAGA